jgi:hypothetical protein
MTADTIIWQLNRNTSSMGQFSPQWLRQTFSQLLPYGATIIDNPAR